MTIIPEDAQRRFWVTATGGKFIITFLCISGAFIGLANAWLTGGEFVATVSLVMSAYVLGNYANNREALRQGIRSESHE